MFKTLREKITTTDQNNRKKSSTNNNNSVDNDSSNENPDGKGLFRFSSLSSLASDLGTAFSKSMTQPLHVQPGQNILYDNESISEYDDSISGGNTLSKEELFQRYQRAKSFAKRYKTRYLEVVECYRKIEGDNNKLTQALTDTQDKHIRRISELKEQIELDRKAKIDVEENYSLMIDEKVELINVLKLQVNLLKEGKDLPPELEEQIKLNHEKSIQFEKKKDDEIKDLKLTLLQRDNLLQRCKDKIGSLNSQLNELKMKTTNLQDVSLGNDNEMDNIAKNDSAVQQRLEIDAVEKELSERINNLLLELEEKKTQYKLETEQKIAQWQSDENQMKSKIKNLLEQNESLSEQLNIKAKIIQNFMGNPEKQPNESLDIHSTLTTLCKPIIDKYPDDAQPLVDKLSRLYNNIPFENTSDVSISNGDDYIEDEASSRLKAYEDEKRFFLSRIEQLEKVKANCEEENIIREKELSQLTVIVENERRDHSIKLKSLEGEIMSLQMELQQCKSTNEKTLQKLSEIQSILIKSEQLKASLVEEKDSLLTNSQCLEETILNMKSQNDNLMQELRTTCNECGDLEAKLASIRQENEVNIHDLCDKNEECKLLKDRIDELMTSLDNLNKEKNNLIVNVNDARDDITAKEERLSLKFVEMQQRFDQEIVEWRDQLKASNDLTNDLSNKVSNFEREKLDSIKTIGQLNEEKEKCVEELKELKDQNQLDQYQIKEFRHQLDGLKQDNVTLLEKIDQETAKLNETLCEKTNLMAINESLLSEKENLMNSCDEMKKTLEALIEDKSTISSILIENTKQLESVQMELDEARIKHQSIQEMFILAQNENDNLKSQLTGNCEIVEKLSTLNHEKIKLMKELEENVSQLNSLRKIQCDLNEEINGLKELKTDLEDNVNGLNKSLAVSEQDRKELETRLTESLSNLTKTIEDHQNEKDTLIKDYMHKITEHELNITRRDESIESLQNLIDSNKKNEKETLSAIEELQNKVILKEESLKSIQNLLDSRIMEETKTVEIIEEHERQKKEYEVVIGEREEAIRSMQMLLEGLRVNEKENIKLIDELKQKVNESETIIGQQEQSIIALNALMDSKNDEGKLLAEERDEKLKQYESLIAEHEKSASSIEKRLATNDERLIEEINMKNEYVRTLEIIESGLVKYCQWVEDVACVEACEGQCGNLSPSSPVYWTKQLESEFENCPTLTMSGRAFDKLLVICYKLHSQLHKTHNVNKIQLDEMAKELVNICTDLNIDGDTNDIQSLLTSIRTVLGSLQTHSFEYQTQCNHLISSLNGHEAPLNLVFDGTTHPMLELESKLNQIIQFYKQDSQSKDESNRLMQGKLETSNSLLSKLFKQLVIIFNLSDINVVNFSDINKQSRAKLIKGLKEYIKKHEHLSTECQQIKLQLDDTEKELQVTLDLNRDIKTELDDLKASVSSDRNRLIATSEELENSLRRLNEVADEKGRIDEEKQSLRKELKEMNDKISNLKLEFEKQHGYQRDLEEQMALQKQSSSMKLSESERKLEEVLSQSEQLLQLNHQYKQLLDDAKLESNKIMSELSVVQEQNQTIQSQLEAMKIEKTTLTETINELQRVHGEILSERDCLKNFKSLKDSQEGELEDIKRELANVKLINHNLQVTITTLHTSQDEMIRKGKSLVEESHQKEADGVNLKQNLTDLQHKLDDFQIKLHEIEAEKTNLQTQLRKSQESHNSLNTRNEELNKLIKTYKNQIDDLKLELEQMAIRHDIEKDELHQQFMEEKSNHEDDLNRKVKKLAKEFNDNIYTKEKEFQQTFEEALSTIRNDESRLKNELRMTIDELNKSIIELQMEKCQLQDLLEEKTSSLKNMQLLLENKDKELQSVTVEMENLSHAVTTLEQEKQFMSVEKISRMNQTVDSSTSYEEMFLDTVGIKDHEVLLMHCTDIEEQLKQLQAENTQLKKSPIGVLNIDQYPPHGGHDNIISSFHSKQSSTPSEMSKTPNLYHGANFRSPNVSCSDYAFCPVPITEATDYEYLHDVLLKYMTGMETEILAKVVCTVMKFSNDETNRVLLFEQDRNKFIRRII